MVHACTLSLSDMRQAGTRIFIYEYGAEQRRPGILTVAVRRDKLVAE
jgi:hypothetical protein